MLGFLSHLISAVTHLSNRFLNRFRSKEARAAAQRKLLDRVKRIMQVLNIKATHHSSTSAAQNAMSMGGALSRIAPSGALASASTGHGANASDEGSQKADFSSNHKTNKAVVVTSKKTNKKSRRKGKSGRNLGRRKGQSRQP